MPFPYALKVVPKPPAATHISTKRVLAQRHLMLSSLGLGSVNRMCARLRVLVALALGVAMQSQDFAGVSSGPFLLEVERGGRPGAARRLEGGSLGDLARHWRSGLGFGQDPVPWVCFVSRNTNSGSDAPNRLSQEKPCLWCRNSPDIEL